MIHFDRSSGTVNELWVVGFIHSKIDYMGFLKIYYDSIGRSWWSGAVGSCPIVCPVAWYFTFKVKSESKKRRIRKGLFSLIYKVLFGSCFFLLRQQKMGFFLHGTFSRFFPLDLRFIFPKKELGNLVSLGGLWIWKQCRHGSVCFLCN